MKRILAGSLLVLSAASLFACAQEKAAAPAERLALAAAAPPVPAPSPSSAADAPRVEPALEAHASARKVMRKAELGLEVKTPAQAESEVTAIAERAGGYVASSTRELKADEGERTLSRVTLALRVPSDKLGSVLADVKRLGSGSASESLSSSDVTDEYIDLEARLKNQRALEDELRELLKRSSSVEDALKVQQQLAGVRTEIDRMEGRRRFIDQESAFATLTLTLNEQRPLLAASPRGLAVNVREACSDALDVGMAVIVGSIRVTGVLAPLCLLFGVPAALLLRWLRRTRRARLATL